MPRTRSLASPLVAAIAAATFVLPLAAQGKSGDKPPKTPPGQARKHVTTNQAVVVARDVLVAHGFTVVRVELVNGAQVIYYRRGNNGRGRGLGPVEKMIVRPAGTIVAFEAAPPKVLVDINIKLGL